MRASRLSPVVIVFLLGQAQIARAADPTPGFPEAVVHWVVQPGETCEAISSALYGSPNHVDLLSRYQRVDCRSLREGSTLVAPAAVTSLPDARLKSINPAVQAHAAGAGWAPVGAGAPLFRNHSVNTLEKGRADIEFTDRTRVFLAENTLVVIYGTAARTSVKKTAPQAVELEAGEVKAGLAALRGEPVEIGLKDGGTVRAASRDAIVQRAGQRTTVEVFDGTADVSSGGKHVVVPTNFGTRFVAQKPPDPPRPLPPAPEWDAGGPGAIAIAPGGRAVLSASWKSVPKAKAYRFEIARDREFHDLVAREEVPAKVSSFRAEQLPAGTYFVSVRAIDDEDYLGIAAALRPVTVVPIAVRAGTVDPSGIELSPYGTITLADVPTGVEMAIGDGAFGPVPKAIDASRALGRSLKLRTHDGTIEVPVRMKAAVATFDATRTDPARVDVRGMLGGTDGVDVAAQMKPELVGTSASGTTRTPLVLGEAGAFTASLPVTPGERVTLEIVDGGGLVLSRAEIEAPRGGRVEPVAGSPPVLRIGVVAPVLTLSAITDVPWISPTAPDAAVVTAAGDRARGKTAGQATFRGSTSIGPVSFDAGLSTQASDTAHGADDAAQLGLRLRTIRTTSLEHGLAVRALVPATGAAPGARIEPSTSIGGGGGAISWLASAGARIRLDDASERTTAPSRQGFLLAGATFDVDPRVRLFGVLDGHLIADGGTVGRGGLSVGVEGGGVLFGGLGARVSPWTDAGGAVTVQVALGLRTP